MRGLARAVALSLLAALLLAPSALAQQPPARKSDNVKWLKSIAEPQVVSARFKGTKMFVSTLKGLAVYEVANPANPQRIGFLPLPHFENEDVDMSVGGNFVLISNDPSEGKGVLYVVDVSNPASPSIKGVMETGIADLGIDPGFGPPSYGTGHTASCVQDCRYAYLAGTRLGIDIVDLTNPAAPKYATPRNRPVPEASGGLATHDVQFDRAGRALITGAGGTAIFNVTAPLAPLLVARTDTKGQSDYAQDFGADGSTLNDLIHHNSHRLPNSSLAAPPAGRPLGADSDTLVVTEEDYQRPTCAGAGSLQTWRVGADNVIRNLDSWEVEIDPTRTALCSAHYFDEAGGLLAQGWYEQGTRFLDVTKPEKIRQVGFWIPQKNVTWGAVYPITDPSRSVVYSLDFARGIDVIRVDRGKTSTTVTPPLDESCERPDVGGARPPSGKGPARAKCPTGKAKKKLARLSVRVSDGRRRARPGATLRYRIRVRNRSNTTARNVRLKVRLPRALRHLRGGRRKRGSRTVTYKLRPILKGKVRQVRLRARVRPGTRAVKVVVIARATATHASSPSAAKGSNRTFVGRARATRSPSPLAARTSAMSAVRAPDVARVAQQAFETVYGLCRRILAKR